MAAERVERDQPADGHAASLRRHLVQAANGLEAHDEVGRDEALFHHPEQVAAAAGNRGGAAGLACVADERQRVCQIARVGVGEGFHARAPRILSRVIGRSFMRVPVALKIAFATAAGAGSLLASPMLFAPNGPSPSSDSMKTTSISGASR